MMAWRCFAQQNYAAGIQYTFFFLRRIPPKSKTKSLQRLSFSSVSWPWVLLTGFLP